MEYSTISVRKIIDRITDGEIRIPSFQRGFVWEPERVAFLMDSIYKKYPFGSLLFWRTREKLTVEKKLGQFRLPAPKKEYPIDYVLDGQQRITSLFTVFQSLLVAETGSDWLDIFFDFSKQDNLQDCLFVALPVAEVDRSKHFPLNVLFDSVKYRQATEGLDKAVQTRIDKLQEAFKEANIPVVQLETEDKEQVAIVFERINRTGIALSSFELLSAWTWSSDFDLQNELEKLRDELRPFGFDEIAEDQDLLLKCCAGILNGKTTPSAVMELDGRKVRENFEAIRTGIKSSIDFLRVELNAHNLAFIPFSGMIVPLAAFFFTEKKNGTLYDAVQKQEISAWFWKSCFSRRYSSGVNEAQRVDIEEMRTLRKDSAHKFAHKIKVDLTTTFFTGNQFNTNTVNTKTFILLLASQMPRSFLSGAPVVLSDALKKASNVEFHHIFPDKHLERLGIPKDQRYQLANFCFLNSADNQRIKDLDPKSYKSMMDQNQVSEILKHAVCPVDALDIEFEKFVDARKELLASQARMLMGS